MSFPRYPKYKPSGVEWLGDMPVGWGVKPLKHIAEFINGDAFKPGSWSESGFPIIRIQNLNGSEDFNYFDGTTESRYLVHDGDLLFGWSGNRGTSFGPFLWRRSEVCVLNQHIFRVVPKSLCKRALYWTLKAVTAHVEDQAHGIIGMVHITKGNLGAIAVPLPPLPEQTAIAEFLDRETGKIDGLVAEQRRLMELLKEKRQAVISHAVTKGLNPHAPMKPSGIEWLGDVPEHWQLPKLKSVATFSGGGTPSRDNPAYWNGDIPWVSPKDMKAERITGAEESVTEEGLRSSASNLLPPGRILIVVRSGILKHTIPIAINETAVALNQDMKALSFDAEKCLGTFFFRWVQGHNDQLLFAWSKQGATVESIEHSYLVQTVVPLPDIGEQAAIIAFLDTELARFDTLTAEAQRAIDLLQERRTALISAAVTGQIDVRNQPMN